MQKNLRKILVSVNDDMNPPKDFATDTMVQIRIIYAKKQFYKFVFNVAKILIVSVILFTALAIHLSRLMSLQNSLMISLIMDQPNLLLSSTGIKAMLEIFPFISFVILAGSVYLLYKFIKQFTQQQIIPLNSPLYEIL